MNNILHIGSNLSIFLQSSTYAFRLNHPTLPCDPVNIVDYYLKSYFRRRYSPPRFPLPSNDLSAISRFGTLIAFSLLRRRNVHAENLVLLVEDDAPLKRSLEKFLNQAGYAFDSCSTAREALALAEKHRHDVVIVDYHLPDSNGSSLLEKLMLVAPAVSAIVLSKFDFQAIADDLDRVKIESFLQKPFDLVELESALSSACSKASKPIRNCSRQPEMNYEGMSASTFARGTLRNGNS